MTSSSVRTLLSLPVTDTPLAGLRVLELGAFIAGPFAGQLLGDLGADVVKVEPAGTGDIMRRYGVRVDGRSLWWPQIARNKRSVAVDLRDTARPGGGRGASRRGCDVVLENFKPGTLARWGMSYADARGRESRGRARARVGLRADRAARGRARVRFDRRGDGRDPAHDRRARPARRPVPVSRSATRSPALFAVIGTLAALQERNRSGAGQEVDVAIYEAVMALMESTVADWEIGGVIRERAAAASCETSRRRTRTRLPTVTTW